MTAKQAINYLRRNSRRIRKEFNENRHTAFVHAIGSIRHDYYWGKDGVSGVYGKCISDFLFLGEKEQHNG